MFYYEFFRDIVYPPISTISLLSSKLLHLLFAFVFRTQRLPFLASVKHDILYAYLVAACTVKTDRALDEMETSLEEQVVLLRLLGEYAGEDVTVRIGQENAAQPFQASSVVATGYGADYGSSLGIVGPTRMDYPSTIAAVRAVARYVSRFLIEG